jgi:hypothetical protein
MLPFITEGGCPIRTGTVTKHPHLTQGAPMTGFRLLLATLLTAVVVYTLFVIPDHGINLFPAFFGDIMKMGWPGQFNVDFMGFLVLSGFWLAWRHQFSPAGLALGVLGFFGGIPVLTTYLLIASSKTGGDVAALLLGPERAAARQ